jgi:hypothetical protein
MDPQSKVYTTILDQTEDFPTSLKIFVASSTISIVFPGMTCGGKFLLTVLRGSSVIAPVAIDLMYMSAGGSIWTINLSSTLAEVEISSGSYNSNWIKICVDVMLVACQLNTAAEVFSDFMVKFRCLADSK